MITASIVLYKNEHEVIAKMIASILAQNVDIKIYLVDNSPTNDLKSFANDLRIIYTHNPSNPGFGAGHNTAINNAIKEEAKYHFIINPDIYFDTEVFKPMVEYLEKHKDVGMMMPQILNPDGSIQYLPKLLPTPLTVLMRKIKFPKKLYEEFLTNYEFRFAPTDLIYDAPVISGCFTLLRLKAIQEIGAYSDRYFMYFEDWDLSRRMHSKYRTLYYPLVSVYHEYYSGANKSLKLFKIYIKSALHFFNKWGWIFDKQRGHINKKSLNQFK